MACVPQCCWRESWCSYSRLYKFCCLWRTLLPSVIIMKPMADFCWICHQNSTVILRAANSSEASKSSTLKEAEEHLRIVQVERSFYKSTYDTCEEYVTTLFTINGEFQPPSLSSNTTPKTNNIKAHYSFNYAQQVHFPTHSSQDLFISYQGSAVCLEWTARPCHGKLISSLTRQGSVVKVPTMSLVVSTTIPWDTWAQ